MKVLVTGAGGFVGTWLVERLKREGHWVRGVDLHVPKWSASPADEFRILDLRFAQDALKAVQDVEGVYHLAADMGGMGFIEKERLKVIRNNTLIDINMLDAARALGIDRFLFSSSACVYPLYRQTGIDCQPLKESDAYPAEPQLSYGWEKLHMEHLLREHQAACVMETRVARFHNCYGSRTEWRGIRAKAPAALSRKIAVAKLKEIPTVEIWGDGTQVRSYMHVFDCVEGLLRLMASSYAGPLNLGRDRCVTVNELADAIADIAGVKIKKVYVEGPKGVQWRNSDNSLCSEVLDWQPAVPLEEGLQELYAWVERQVRCILEKGDEL